VRFPPILREINAIIDLRLAHRVRSSPQRTNNPYAQFDDRNYEMNDVKSTTNLTAGLPGGGGQESMSDFYDEVRICAFPTPLSMTFARYHGLPTPAGFHRTPSLYSEQPAHTDPRLPTHSRSPPSKAV
jgi:hypothetical protein